MKIHEYQAKEILRRFNVPVPKGRLATTPDEAEAIARELGGGVCVVKAQIHAGGRGKGGGVKLARSPEEARERAREILGMQLVTHQTGPGGQKVRRVLVEQGCDIARELYLGMTLDRDSSRLTLMASSEGGVEIEEIASKHPEKILKTQLDPVVGLSSYQGRKLAYGLGLGKEVAGRFVEFARSLSVAYEKIDASLAEINPLVLTKGGEVLALDAKINIDDNALFRHPDIAAMRDPDEEDPRENDAKKFDLSYIALEGNIGCMVNGAGLAMATMDIIKLAGGQPANFLDVGGGADAKKVTAAFKLILGDVHVKAVLVNIFGGIMKCDVIAEGIVTAAREVGLRLPLVVRLEGTNVDKGKAILAQSGLAIIPADGMRDAAEKVVAAAKQQAAA
ncbi:MAG: ADP-forming succinate--CoA ligase subunit beta [Deltaproteobacteria bacterium]